MTRINLPAYANEDCPNCRTTHRLPVEGDYEDGYYVDMQTTRCHHDTCTRDLCSSCPQFTCDNCTLVFCEEHRVRLGDETVCEVCADLIRRVTEMDEVAS